MLPRFACSNDRRLVFQCCLSFQGGVLYIWNINAHAVHSMCRNYLTPRCRDGLTTSFRGKVSQNVKFLRMFYQFVCLRFYEEIFKICIISIKVFISNCAVITCEEKYEEWLHTTNIHILGSPDF